MMLFCLGKKTEGRELVKKGVMLSLQSYVCWHVYGSLHKLEKNYEEAIKCFTQALRIGPDNVQVYRELCSLQMQTRNYESCKEARATCISNRIGPKTACLGYIVAYHLMGNHQSALMFLDEYLKILPGMNSNPYETSETYLYKAFMLLESKKYDIALDFLDSKSTDILDKSSLMEFKAEALISLDKLDDAKEVILKLLDRNCECEKYYQLFCRANGIKISAKTYPIESLVSMKGLLKKYTKSKYLNRIILGLYDDSEFMEQIDKYLRAGFVKGVPPLFVQVEYLYEDPKKLKIIENLIEQYSENLSHFKTLGPIKEINDEDSIRFIEPPTTNLWLDYFRAQHYRKLKNYKKALKIINDQLMKTPTIVDFYNFVSSCLRECGDYISASRWSQEAQSLDTADRYINSVCVRSLLQANRIPEAEKMAFKFTFGSKSSVDYLTDMQCVWFLAERGKAYLEQKNYGMALKMCHQGDRCYSSNYDDQMDFHSYCVRKATLRSYVECIRLCDNIRSHGPYYDIASTAIKIYLHLFKNPKNEFSEEPNQVISFADKKRKAKERKAAIKAKEEAEKLEAEKREKNKHHNHQHENQSSIQEDDPTLLPENLIKPEKPLDEAKRFLMPLIINFSDKIETHCLAFEVFERREKLGMMFNAIAMGHQLHGASSNPWLHECTVRFLIYYQNLKKNIKIDQEYKDEETAAIYKNYYDLLFERIEVFFKSLSKALTSPINFNEYKTRTHSEYFAMSFSTQLCKAFIDPNQAICIYDQFPKISDKRWSENVTWEDAFYVYNRMLNSINHSIAQIDSKIIETHRADSQKMFPFTTVFHSDEEKQKLREALIQETESSKDLGLYSIPDLDYKISMNQSRDVIGRIDEWIAKLSINDLEDH